MTPARQKAFLLRSKKPPSSRGLFAAVRSPEGGPHWPLHRLRVPLRVQRRLSTNLARTMHNRRAIKVLWALAQGWVRGLEPPTFGATVRRSNQLSYTHHVSQRRAGGTSFTAPPQAVSFGRPDCGNTPASERSRGLAIGSSSEARNISDNPTPLQGSKNRQSPARFSILRFSDHPAKRCAAQSKFVQTQQDRRDQQRQQIIDHAKQQDCGGQQLFVRDRRRR